jgi:hypothetical protein
MLNSNAKIFIFVCLLFTFNQALARQALSLYDVEVLVVDESKKTRLSAFKDGLNEVFIRIAGDSIVMDKLKSPAASRYIKQYSYDPVENPETNADGELLSHRLKIQYNGNAMEKYLRDNGFPVWGEHRAEVVVWLAIRDGRNEYVLKDTDQSLLKSSADAALQRRGIPQRWPLYDYKDRKILKVADIRGGFKDPVVAASKRYSRGPALTGSLIWAGSKWQSSWSLLMGSGNRHWSIEDADYDHLINKAVDQAADAMGNVFAIHGVGKDQKLASIQLDIQDVNSIKKYRKLENYLRDLSAVVSVTPLAVDGQSAVFEVALRSSEQDFLILIKNDAELVEVKPIQRKSKVQIPAQDSQPETGELDVVSEAEKNVAVLATTTGSDDGEGDLPLEPSEVQPAVEKKKIPVYFYKLIN